MASGSARQLIVLRHAKSAWPDGVPDHDRPLAGRGRRDAPAAGRWLAESGHVPDRVLCSTAQRARETWKLAEAELGTHPKTVYEDRVYGASAAELLDLAHEMPESVQTLMLVGHDPAMRELTLDLASPTQPAAPAARPWNEWRSSSPPPRSPFWRSAINGLRLRPGMRSWLASSPPVTFAPSLGDGGLTCAMAAQRQNNRATTDTALNLFHVFQAELNPPPLYGTRCESGSSPRDAGEFLIPSSRAAWSLPRQETAHQVAR